jgi:hypothetical protein
MMKKVSWKKACRKRGEVAVTEVGRVVCVAAFILTVLWLIPGCPNPSGDKELKKEVEALKSDVASMKEKIIQLEAGQKVLLGILKGESPKAAAPAAPQATTPEVAEGQPAMPGQAAAAPLTVEELFKNKDQLVGTRVTVKGVPGPVLMHKKTLFLSGAPGMVEVLYGNLADKKQVERLTSQTIETPITLSGLLSTAPGQSKEAVRLVIMADTVEF